MQRMSSRHFQHRCEEIPCTRIGLAVYRRSIFEVLRFFDTTNEVKLARC